MAAGPRTIVLFGESGSSHEHFLQHWSTQLRAKQGEEIAEWFREDEAKARPGLFKHQTTDTIQAVVDKIQVAQAKQELVVSAEAAAAAATEAQKEQQKQEEEEDEIEDEMEEIGASPNALLASATSARLGKKRGRGRAGKGGKGKGARGEGMRSGLATTPGPGRGQKRSRQQQQPQQQTTSAGHTSTAAASTAGSPSTD
eukprot:2647601-Amphidinium_carterae.1